MNIGVATEDKINVGEHFGGSSCIIVAIVENGKIVNKEERHLPGHEEFAKSEHHPQTSESGKHGFGLLAEKRHKIQLEVFKDCDVLITGLIGTGAYNFFKNAGIEVIATDIKGIDDVISLCAQGKLEHTESLMD